MTSIAGFTENLTIAEIEARNRRERILQLKKNRGTKAHDSAVKPSEIVPEPVTNNNVTDEQSSENEAPPPAKWKANPDTDEQDITKIAARKIDWDLKKGIEKSLAILQERTNDVIAEMVREQIGDEASGD